MAEAVGPSGLTFSTQAGFPEFSEILGHMRPKAKRLLITTEKHETFIVRLGTQPTVRGFCPTCDMEVDLLTLDSAVNVSAIGGREVVGRIASEEIHAIETANGHLLVCRSSLPGVEVFSE